MGVDTHITSRAGESLSFTVGNVLFCFGISVLFGHAKVDDVNDIGSFGAWSANEKVVRLDIAVDKVLFVNGLNAEKHLLCNHDS